MISKKNSIAEINKTIEKIKKSPNDDLSKELKQNLLKQLDDIENLIKKNLEEIKNLTITKKKK